MTPSETDVKSKETCTHISELKTRATHGPEHYVTKVRWTFNNAGVMAPRFIVNSERENEIEELADGTTEYRHWQTFAGLAAKTVRKKYEGALRERYAEWCRDLKGYVEGKHKGGGGTGGVKTEHIGVGHGEAKTVDAGSQ